MCHVDEAECTRNIGFQCYSGSVGIKQGLLGQNRVTIRSNWVKLVTRGAARTGYETRVSLGVLQGLNISARTKDKAGMASMVTQHQDIRLGGLQH